VSERKYKDCPLCGGPAKPFFGENVACSPSISCRNRVCTLSRISFEITEWEHRPSPKPTEKEKKLAQLTGYICEKDDGPFIEHVIQKIDKLKAEVERLKGLADYKAKFDELVGKAEAQLSLCKDLLQSFGEVE